MQVEYSYEQSSCHISVLRTEDLRREDSRARCSTIARPLRVRVVINVHRTRILLFDEYSYVPVSRTRIRTFGHVPRYRYEFGMWVLVVRVLVLARRRRGDYTATSTRTNTNTPLATIRPSATVQHTRSE
eukprot:scaffold360579_cov21-Prasinocladus_malaysianus.AAC.1